MLRITVSKNCDAAVSYYNKGLSKQDYYLDQKEAEGQWHGKTAAMLGLSGKVEKRDFELVVKNRHPETGKRITVRDAMNRRGGYDFTFSAPKSASIIFGITGSPEILMAHRAAVQRAMEEVEADMQTQVNQGGKKSYESTGNIIYAAFDHYTSRPVKTGEDRPLEADMQLHTHCFVLNCSYVESKERYQAIEEGNVHRNAGYYEALYHSHFSHELRKAGYGVERTEKRWEVKGIGRGLIEKFSNRTLEVEKRAEAEKNLTVKQKAALGALTRKNKNSVKTIGNLKDAWGARLTAVEKQAIYAAKSSHQQAGKGPELTPQESVRRSLEHLLERKSAVPEKKVLEYAMKIGYGTLSPSQVKTAMKEQSGLVRASKNGNVHVTTREMLELEDGMIAFASGTKGSKAPLNPNYRIRQDFLNEEQRRAVSHILSSRDQVVILSGGAGVGKSSLLNEVKMGIEEKGKSIFAFAPTAEASRKNLREKGFDDANTIAKFLQDKELQGKTRDQVIVIDEAGQVSVRNMHAIFSIAKAQNAKLLLSGDHRQHTSVEAGDALRLLEEKSGLEVARVRQVVRQSKNPQYRQAIQSLSIGHTESGFRKLDRMGCVVEIGDMAEREERIANDYLKSIEAGRSAIVVSPTHAEGNKISSAIRCKLQKNKRLGNEERRFVVQHNLSFTEAQKLDVKLYRDGTSVQFYQNTRGGFRAGEKYDVTGALDESKLLVRHSAGESIMELDLVHSKKFQVFEKKEIAVASGETIRITANGQTMEKNRMNNGQVYQVTGFTKNGDIKLSNGKTLDKNYRNFQYGYCRTSHAVQGRDAQDVLIAQSAASFTASNEKQFYVSVSRGTETCRIYTDDKMELKRAISRSGDRMAAQEVRQDMREQSNRKRKLRFYLQQINKNFGHGREDAKQPEKDVSWARDLSRR